MFFNNITDKRVSKKLAIQLRKGLVRNEPKLKIVAKNQRSIITILKAEAVYIQA
jgi:hypothetical protein